MSLTARPGFLKLVREITGDLWERRVREWDQEGRAQELQVRAAGEEISALVKRIGKTGDEELVREYEREVKELRAARERAERILKKHQEGPPNFEEALERVGTLLQSPYLIWKAGDRDVKRAVVERVFQTAPTYDRESGFGTVDLALPYQLSQAYAEPDSRMVDPAKKFWNTFIEFALENHPKLKQIYYAEPESEPDRSD
ncbi:hypothetical protein KGQ71_01490 [Patescibacteria group bacterium]|nr:hypothetical protein [Patescibacteria group bacterium]